MFYSAFPGRSSVNYQAQETRSRLSKTVEQILRDSVALPYYLQFMETRSAEHLVRFWLEAESFRSTSWSRVRAHSLNSVKHSSLAEPASALGSPGSPDSPSAISASSGVDVGESEDPFSSRSPQDTSSNGGAELGHQNSVYCERGSRPGTPQQLPLRAETPSRLPSVSSRTGTPVKGQSTSALRELSDKLMKSEYWEMSKHIICWIGDWHVFTQWV